MIRRALEAVERLSFALLVFAAACGSNHPTAPKIAEPSVPLRSVQVDWDGLARLFDDPMYKDLPGYLGNREAAQPLGAAVSDLVTGIHAKDLATVIDAMTRNTVARAAYFRCPCYQVRERPILLTMSLFHMRGRALLPQEYAAMVPEVDQ